MSKQNLLTVVISVVSSIVLSIVANLVFDRQREHAPPDVVRVKRVELIDAQGRVMGAFELVQDGHGRALPHLVMRDSSGRDSIEMSVDGRGDGVLGFSNDYWNEGAIILGHLQNVDDGTESKNRDVPDKTGAWGLRVRSPQGQYTGMGFFNSSRPIEPLSVETKR
ncbi:MAG: hypothetical protein WDN23_02965 [Edaphobacter sp.]